MRAQGVAAHHKRPLKETRRWSGLTVSSSEPLQHSSKHTCCHWLTPLGVQQGLCCKDQESQWVHYAVWLKNSVIQSSCFIIMCPAASSESLFSPQGGAMTRKQLPKGLLSLPCPLITVYVTVYMNICMTSLHFNKSRVSPKIISGYCCDKDILDDMTKCWTIFLA